MITLRTFDDPAEAAIAKSALEAQNIFCSLADENVHTTLLAAIPIRLLVRDDQLQDATRILDLISEKSRGQHRPKP